MNPNKIVGKVEQQAHVILNNNYVNRIVLGLSGGADSVALLRVLLRLGCRVNAIHCNFHLRDAESDRDMDFCRNLCHELNVPLDIVHFNVPEYENIHNVSTEIACRELRYDYFRKMAGHYHADRIAVAHHADDNIETLFLNLFRGTGVSGLRGMLPDANGIIRPFLTTTRQEILDYLSALDQDYIIDSSNLSNDYRRNFIRNELIPAIETRWTGARKAITNTISNLQSDDRALVSVENACLDTDRPDFLPYQAIRRAPDVEWLVHRWTSRFGCRSNVAREIAALMKIPANESPETFKSGPGRCTGRPESGKKWPAKNGSIIATKTGLLYQPNPNSDK